MGKKKKALKHLLKDMAGSGKDKPKTPEGTDTPEESPTAPAYTPEPEISEGRQKDTKQRAALREMLNKMNR